jgi:L-iditol 2-dehydrogenase
LPENVEYEEAAMMEPMAVAVHAMRRVQVRQEDSVVVCGLGTIGMLLVMLLCEAGVRNIYVIGNKELQKRHMLRLGISEEHYCDSRREQVDKWLVEHVDKIDVFFECVGKNETIAWAVDAVAPGGRICLVGNPYGDVRLTKEVYWKILRNQLMITGTWNSSFTMEDTDDWWYVLKRLEEHRIHPAEFVSHRYDLEHIEYGLLIMRDKTEEYGKIMVSGLDLNNRT